MTTTGQSVHGDVTSPPAPVSPSRWAEPQTFDELGRPLRDLTFCVVDLETTGASHRGGARITEVGAVKVRGGEVLGEFQTLVDPHGSIPAFISLLTGITDAMVAGAPSIETVLPQFLEFAAGCVLVAHNAPFDVGFLKAVCAEQERAWPAFDVLDTAVIARRVVHRDETPDCKLASLARLFRATTTPDHRALSDARATVDVLHGLLERLGNLGVQTFEELQTYTSRVTTAQRRRRHLAEHLPHSPGVYLFRDAQQRVLYVGTSKDLRRRVRGYFTAAETRSRMGRMVGLATEVQGIVCATPLEAGVREVRLIAAHRPPFNRRSRHPDKVHWVRVTAEPWPRLAIVRRVCDDEGAFIGPFRTKARAQEAVDALHETFPVRQCTLRLPRRPDLNPCALAEMGRCLAPCDGQLPPDDYAATVDSLRRSLRSGAEEVVGLHDERMRVLSAEERYEEAGRFRDRLASFLRGAARAQRVSALTRCPQIVAARRDEGRWHVHVIRHGRLAAAGVIPPGADATSWTAELVAGAEQVPPGHGPLPASSIDEAELLVRWLESPGVRLIEVEGSWTCPAPGAARHIRAYAPDTAVFEPGD
jgi:DNA polymerase III subunit epsilon